MGESRKELTALHADVVGYSRALADDRDATTTRMQEYRELVEEKVAAGAGTLVDFAGDAFMAVFPAVAAALQAAIEIATEVERRNAETPEHRRLMFRMGIDQGEVLIADGQYFGDALNIAARVQALARPGGISVTSRIYTALDEPSLRFLSRGRQSLKNIPEGVEVYDFSDLPSFDQDRVSRASHGLALESPSVAILPIHSEGLGPELGAAAESVRSDLIHRLARNPSITVIDAREDADGHQRGGSARYMIESGLMHVGESVRIYAILFDVVSMNVVKSHKWTGPLAGLLEASERLADAMGNDIEVDFILGAPAGFYSELDDPRAVEHIQLGWFNLNQGTAEGWESAVEHFSALVDAHSDQPYGYVLLGFTLWVGASNGFASDPESALSEALVLSQEALETGDPTGMAAMIEAAVHMSRGDSEAAIAAIDGVAIVRPTCDTTFGLEGSVRRYLGEWERAVDLEDHAMRLAGADKPWYPTVKACSLFMSGRVEQALSVAEMVVEHQPQNLEALLILAAAQSRLGLERRARATATRIREQFPGVDVEKWLERNPYRDQSVLEAWRADLAGAGVL